jgi:hypothetical protein
MSSEALSSPAAPKSTAAQEGSASEEQATTLGPRLPTRGLAPVAGEADEEQEWSLKSGPEGQQQKNKEKLDPREELQRTLLRVQAEAGDHMVVELIRELGKGSYGVVFQGIWWVHRDEQTPVWMCDLAVTYAFCGHIIAVVAIQLTAVNTEG